MVVICLADVADRFHGFLRSCMLNPHPGVYVAMDLDAGSRERDLGDPRALVGGRAARHRADAVAGQVKADVDRHEKLRCPKA